MEEKIYPRWKYHEEEPACVVSDEQEENELGKGWADAPFPEKEPEPEKCIMCEHIIHAPKRKFWMFGKKKEADK